MIYIFLLLFSFPQDNRSFFQGLKNKCLAFARQSDKDPVLTYFSTVFVNAFNQAIICCFDAKLRQGIIQMYLLQDRSTPFRSHSM